MENTVHVDQLPGSPSAFRLPRGKRRLSVHMRLEVWQPDLQPRSRELALQLSEDPPFKNESLPRASLAPEDALQADRLCTTSTALLCNTMFCDCGIGSFSGPLSWHNSEDAYKLASYGLVTGRRGERLQPPELVKRLPQNCSCSTDAYIASTSDHEMNEFPMTLLKSSCFTWACRGSPWLA